MSNDTAKTQTVNFLPVQATYEPLYPYDIITFIGPAGQPFYAPVDPNLDGVNITNSTINSTTIGATTPSTAAFTTATMTNQPVGNNDLCNKTYVDAAIVGISWKQPVRAATTISITLSGAQTIDTVPVVAGDRVLVKDQSSAAQNGIYVVGTPWTRSSDADTWDELISAMVFVESGSQAGSAYYCPIQPGGTLGVTAVTWSNFSVAGTYFAGTGLSLAANTFSITNTGVSANTYGSASSVPVFAVNAQGQLTSVTNTNIAIGASAITSGTIDTARISGNYSGITGVGTLTDLTVTNTISGSINGNAATATSATSATTATNLAGGAAGSLPYQSSSGTTAMLAAGSNGQFLTLSSGLPAWTSAPSASLTISADTANATRYPVFNDAATGSASTLYTTSAKYTFNPSTGTLSTTAHYLDYLDFNTGATVTPAIGRAWWGTTGTLNFRIDSGTGYDTQVNEQIFVYGKASSAITKGQLVIKTGVVGSSGVITMGPSTAGITDGNAFVGVAYEDIALNAFGRVVAVGLAKGFNLSAYNNNDTLWYDPAGGGAMTTTKPSAPNIKAEIGIVTNNGSGGSGSMYVKIFPGSQLGGTDQNVQLSTPISDNSLLQYYLTGGYWRNVASSTVSVGTATNLAGGATGSLPYQSAADTTTFLAAGSDGQVLKLASGVPTWSSDASGVTIVDDTTTNATRYLTFTSATTGNVTTQNVASTKLQFNPSTGFLTSTGFIGGAGTVSAPAYTTSGDTNTGIFFPAADTIAFTEGGTEALRINSSAQVAVNTTGSAAAPVITKADDLNTGIFFPAADTIAASTGGSERWRIDSSGNVSVGGTITAGTFSGSGASLTNLNASNLSTGTVGTARLASGTANSSTYLRGDQTWASISVSQVFVAYRVSVTTTQENRTGFQGTSFLNSTSSYVSGLTAITHTCASSSNYIMLKFSAAFAGTANSDCAQLQFFVDGSPVGSGAFGHMNNAADGGTRELGMTSQGICFPNDTSSHTYMVGWAATESGSTVQINGTHDPTYQTQCIFELYEVTPTGTAGSIYTV